MALAVVTGASGLLGGNLVIELLARGHRVRATRRASSRIAHLDPFDIEWVDTDLSDRAGLEAAFAGADVVFHCAAQVTVRREVSTALRQTNVEGTKNVLAAFRAAASGRLVYVSTVGAVGMSVDGTPCTEDAEWNFDVFDMADGYVTTKRWAEDIVRAHAAGGLDVVIGNPTYMLGPFDAKISSGKLIVDVVRGKAPGRAPGKNNFVDVRDVARGLLLCWEKGVRGERYILGGRNMTYGDTMALIAEIAGVHLPSRQVPKSVARVLGWAGDVQERLSDSEPLLNSVTIGYAFTDRFIFASDKAQRELGYTISPLEPAIRDAVTWFRDHAIL